MILASIPKRVKLPANRRGFKVKEINDVFCPEPPPPSPESQPFVYFNSKFSHTGITSYKVFENINRFRHPHSLSNLLNQATHNSEYVEYLVKCFKDCETNDERSKIIDEAVQDLTYEEYKTFLNQTFLTRTLNPTQSRKTRSLCQKLEYYTAVRKFKSKKSGNYSFKVAFLTLTAPGYATSTQLLHAFNHFLDYLRRTANCVYVWKKELGESGGNLHFHLMLNNFIPYYIVNWKWKRLLIAEGVQWPINVDGKETESHYRIELPRSRKKIGHYISKYMSKAYGLPRECGYVAGHSTVLDECKDITIIESDLPWEEIDKIMSSHKVVRRDYVTHVCVDLLHVKAIAPKIGALFESQYISFCEKITMPQKFFDC